MGSVPGEPNCRHVALESALSGSLDIVPEYSHVCLKRPRRSPREGKRASRTCELVSRCNATRWSASRTASGSVQESVVLRFPKSGRDKRESENSSPRDCVVVVLVLKTVSRDHSVSFVKICTFGLDSVTLIIVTRPRGTRVGAAARGARGSPRQMRERGRLAPLGVLESHGLRRAYVDLCSLKGTLQLSTKTPHGILETAFYNIPEKVSTTRYIPEKGSRRLSAATTPGRTEVKRVRSQRVLAECVPAERVRRWAEHCARSLAAAEANAERVPLLLASDIPKVLREWVCLD